MIKMLQYLLQHPLTRGLDIDDPGTTQIRRNIIQKKAFLRRIYEEWYTLLVTSLPADQDGGVLEIGSGAGFLKDFIPEAISSEIFFLPGVDIVLDGCELPFKERTLRGILMTDVFHHLTKPRNFLREATRCVKPRGVIAMVEPWLTPMSCWVYQNLHHEPFRPDAKEWGSQRNGPLSEANGALPWIIFQRDSELFLSEFPQWKIQTIEPLMPFRYVVSGGISLRSLQPGWSYGIWCKTEEILKPVWDKIAMFARIVIKRV